MGLRSEITVVHIQDVYCRHNGYTYALTIFGAFEYTRELSYPEYVLQSVLCATVACTYV